MSLPNYHALTELETMQSHIDSYPLGAWVCIGRGCLMANHIAFVLDRTQAPRGN